MILHKFFLKALRKGRLTEREVGGLNEIVYMNKGKNNIILH